MGMVTVNLVKKNRYQDSVTLMQAAVKLRELVGIEEASLMMGTEPNKEILREAGLFAPEGEGERAGPNDLIVALRGTEEVISTARQQLEDIMRAEIPASGKEEKKGVAHSLAEGLAAMPDANLVLISTPGIYAAAEARKALAQGLHVMIFSDNVALQDEIDLKKLANERDLLLMGPDCGTAIIGGVPLGFANAVRRGAIGVVGASGTGMQEITTLVDRYGGGISHAIGAGSRDLSADVGGASTLAGLAALQNDPETQVIVIVSKPPDEAVAARVIEAAGKGDKPVVIVFLGMAPRDTGFPHVTMVEHLDQAALLALTLWAMDGGQQTDDEGRRTKDEGRQEASGAPGTPQGKGYMRGLFSGGTFCYEAMLILQQSLGPIYSNTPLSPEQKIEIHDLHSAFRIPHSAFRNRHVCLDLGADEFTVGRPHPMIDMTARAERILVAAEDPEVAVLLLDVVLGYGAHPDPAGVLAPVIKEAKARAEREGRNLAVVASICGTEADPQVFSRQQQALEAVGVLVAGSNANAAMLASALYQVPSTEYRVPSAELYPHHSLLDTHYALLDTRVLNVGVRTFADTLARVGAPHLHIEWQPPAQGDPQLGRLLAVLMDETPGSLNVGARIKAANVEAIERILSADPVWEDVRPACEIWPEMGDRRRDATIQRGDAETRSFIDGTEGMTAGDRLLLHSGPPIGWERMCGPMQGAVIGAILLEGWAEDEAGARKLAESGGVKFAPCHHYGAVGPMAGVVSPSMPMFVVRNADRGNIAYSSLNEGMGKVLRYGAFAPEVLARLRWMCSTLGPALQVGIRALGGIHLKPLMAQALQMGDELHNRHIAATALLFKTLAPALIRALDDRERAASVLEPIAANNYFFLNLAMAACKATLDAAHGIPYSSVVTAMARNGVDFGIRVSGTGDRWFTGPVGIPKGLYLPGFTQDDAAGDIGDSAITETAGLGGFAMGGAPAVVKVVGGTPADAIAYTDAMYTITLARNPHWTLPPLGFAGTPTGIDVRRVLDSNTLPIINTGIAHKEAGIGQVGAGLVNPPIECFTEALRALGENVKRET